MNRTKKYYDCCRQGEWSSEKGCIVCSLTKQACPVFSVLNVREGLCLCRNSDYSKRKAFKKFDLSVVRRKMPMMEEKKDDSFYLKEGGVKIYLDKNDIEVFSFNFKKLNVELHTSMGYVSQEEEIEDTVKACEWSINRLHEMKMELEGLVTDIDKAIDRCANGMLNGYVEMKGRERRKLYPYSCDDGKIFKLRHGGSFDKRSEDAEKTN